MNILLDLLVQTRIISGCCSIFLREIYRASRSFMGEFGSELVASCSDETIYRRYIVP